MKDSVRYLAPRRRLIEVKCVSENGIYEQMHGCASYLGKRLLTKEAPGGLGANLRCTPALQPQQAKAEWRTGREALTPSLPWGAGACSRPRPSPGLHRGFSGAPLRSTLSKALNCHKCVRLSAGCSIINNYDVSD